jgi:acetylornithine deacetylase/succinyl-diaminopimelate desuccinylase-like protein
MTAPPAGTLDAVLGRIDAADVADLAQRLVRSVADCPPGRESATAALLADEARRRGLEVTVEEVAPDRPNVLVTLPGGPGPGVLLVGHTDVVPIGDGWSVDPHGGLVQDGRLHGRGSADMFGGLAAALVAMAALADAGVPRGGPVTLAALVDEEDLGIGVRRYVETLAPDRYGACLVAEPTSLQRIVAARGDAYVEVVVTGVAAHSGNPDDGRNAIQGMAAVVAELERWHHELAAAPHPLVGPATWSVGTVEGGQMTSTVPDHCRLTADRRLLPGESAEDVLTDIRTRLGTLGLAERGLGLSVAMDMDMPGFETSAEDPFVDAVGAALAAAGVPVQPPGGWTAACDGGFVAQRTGVPVVVLGPGSVAEQAHRPDESVEVAEVVAAARVYAALLAAGPEVAR